MLLYSDLTYAINGAAFHIYNKLGHGFLEAVYQEALEIEFQRRNIPYEREKELKITYDGVELKQTYYPFNPSHPWSNKKEKYEMCCNSGGICHKVGGVDQELSQAIVEDWREYHFGKDA